MSMKRARILEHVGHERVTHASLMPALRERSAKEFLMGDYVMRREERETCRWLGFPIVKGVTHPERNISAFAHLHNLASALHAELAAGFPDVHVDPTPLCYAPEHHFGFGGFVRWAYFVNPEGGAGFMGIDWSYHLRPTGGVAHSMRRVSQTVRALARHGLPLDEEIVLLNGRMCESPYLEDWRQAVALVTVRDWLKRGPVLFRKGSTRCPRCGQPTMRDRQAKFCSFCGCQPQLVCKDATF
jgi:hypothetical protein